MRMYQIIYVLIGLVIGIILTYALLKRSLVAQVQAQFKQWKLENEQRIRKSVLNQSRVVLKGRIGEQMALLLPSFNYNPSDARFIGNPIDYIIFENYTEMKERKSKEPITITFMDVKTGQSDRLTRVEGKIRKTVENHRVKWETLHIKDGEN